MPILRRLTISSLLFGCALNALAQDAAKKPNPTHNYLLNGLPVEGWTMIVGDPNNWWQPIKDLPAKSGSGKLTVEPSNYLGQNDALKLSWAPRKEANALFTISSGAIDLKAMTNQVALTFDIKVDVMPDKDVIVSMGCGDKCTGELHLRKTIADLKKGEWTTMPIPLNCFSKEGADLSKINTPVSIATAGKMTIEIANVRLLKLADGDTGCAK
jgi:hypothetical protein